MTDLEMLEERVKKLEGIVDKLLIGLKPAVEEQLDNSAVIIKMLSEQTKNLNIIMSAVFRKNN